MDNDNNLGATTVASVDVLPQPKPSAVTMQFIAALEPFSEQDKIRIIRTVAVYHNVLGSVGE